jgi:hypothetical protein
LLARFSVLIVACLSEGAKAADLKPVETGSSILQFAPSRKTAGLVTLRESRVNAAGKPKQFRRKKGTSIVMKNKQV